MSTIPVWMDVDTGTDDAVAIMALHALKETRIVGLSAVCGNTALDNSYLNTRAMNTICGTSYPVYRGADRPLFKEPFHSDKVHGANGLGDVEIPLPENEKIYEEAAWDALYAAAVKEKGELRLVATGPLTDVAIAFMKYPDLPKLLHSVLIMGGATREGNVTPCAEFNIYADPEAAEAVFKSGAKIVMCPLDVTEKVCFSEEEIEEMLSWGNKAGKYVHDILLKPLSFHKGMGHPGVQMHDSCPVLYLAYPELFDGEEAGVVIETKGRITAGKTVTDLYSDKQFDFKNAYVVLDVDAEAFMSKLKECIKACP